MVEDVVAQYKAANMNLETVYLDIPYMKDFSDFSVDTAAFPDLKTFQQNLKASNQKIVPIIDGAMSADDLQNKYYQRGDLYNIFIKSGIHSSVTYNNNLISKVWPERAVFVDWLDESCLNLVVLGLDDLFNIFEFDGLWIDMNEATTFKNGEIDPNPATPPTE
jgi:alpha-glucosidase (family GH31 glycosyl hydrolase)